MRSLSSGLICAVVAGFAVAGSIGTADARGHGGGGFAAGGRVGGFAHQRGRIGGGTASFGRRFGGGERFGRGYGRDRDGSGYGLGYLGLGFGGDGYGYGYGVPSAGAFGPRYDFGPPTSIGIPAPPVAPPAIYVIGGAGRASLSGAAVRGRRSARTLAPQPSRAGDGVAASGPRIIRIAY